MAKVVWLGPAAARSPRLERRSLRCLFSAAHVKKKSSRASGWSATIRSVSVCTSPGASWRAATVAQARCSSSGSFEASTCFHWLAMTPIRRSGSSDTGTIQLASFTIGRAGLRRPRRRRGGGGVTRPPGR